MPLRLSGVSRSVSDVVRVFFSLVGGVKRNLEDRLKEEVSVMDFGAVGDGVTDDAPAIQAALDYVASIGGTLFFPSPPTYYRCASIQSPANGATFYVNSEVHLRGELGELRNFNGAHFFMFGTGANNSTVEKMYLNHNAQAVDDLSASAVAALDPGDYPYAVHSGYGTEEANGVFGKMHQYVGWPFGTGPDGTEEIALIFLGSNCTAKHNHIHRAQRIAIAFGSLTTSFNAEGCIADSNRITESRFNAFGLRRGSKDCKITNNTILETLQIGVAGFVIDATRVSDYHLVSGNTIVNTRPLGENGIEMVAVSPHLIHGGTVVNNFISGFGSVGIRTVQAEYGLICANEIRNMNLLSDQQTRYPGAFDGTGIFTHTNTTGWQVMHNVVDDVLHYGLAATEDTNQFFGNRLVNIGNSPQVYIAGSSFLGSETRLPGRMFSPTASFTGLGNYADDTAAATGGVPVNGLYHTSGALKVRIS